VTTPRPALDITPAPRGYHSEADLEAALDAAAAAGERVTRRVIGHSVEGRPLHALTIAAPGRLPDPARPHVVIQGGMHGNEVIGTEVALHLLGLLTEDGVSGSIATLLDLADVTVLPCVNPDGRQATMRSVASTRRLPTPRRNANGVDLNRNWPRPDDVADHWLPISGTPNPRLPWYRGPEPLSEPESRAILSVLEDRPPAAMLDLHSSGEILIYPWTSKAEPPPDEAGYWQMIDAFRARQERRFTAKQSREWYPIVGSLDDYAYDRFGTLLLTVELGRPAEAVRSDPRRWKGGFWWANPLEPDVHARNVDTGCFDALVAGVRYRTEHPRAERPGVAPANS